MGAGERGLFLSLRAQGHHSGCKLFGRAAVFPGTGVRQVCPLWGGGGGQRPPGGAVGGGFGSLFRLFAALARIPSHPLRGGAAGSDSHSLVPVGAEGGQLPRTIRAGGGIFAPAAHRGNDGISQRLPDLYRRPVCGGVLSGGGVRLFSPPGGEPASGPYRGRQSQVQPGV